MPTFDTIAGLAEYMNNNVLPDVMLNEAHEVVSEEQSRMVQQEVYSPYDPYQYDRRRTQGGLADTRNMIGSISYGLQGIEYVMENITQGENGYELAGLIEYGHNNGHGSYEYTRNRDGTQERYLQARPFISSTIESLQRSLAHVEAVRRGLRRRGIETT